MIADVDIWRAANLLVKQHGDNAALVAAQRADDLLAAGDVDGRIIWGLILQAIRDLQRARPLALGVALLVSACDASVGRMLDADAAAITADKAKIDRDTQACDTAALVADNHQLYLDVEQQEHDRGTEDDELAEGEWPR